MIRYHEPEAMIGWAAEQIDGKYRDDARAIGVEEAGSLIAVGVFDTWFFVKGQPTDCHFSLVTRPGARWQSRSFFQALAAFPFITAGCIRATSHIPENNAEAIAGAMHLGMQFEGRLRGAARDDGDILVFGLLRRDCRWVPRQPIL